MIYLKYILPILFIFLLFLLRRYFPNQRVFLIFCAILAAAAAAIFVACGNQPGGTRGCSDAAADLRLLV